MHYDFKTKSFNLLNVLGRKPCEHEEKRANSKYNTKQNLLFFKCNHKAAPAAVERLVDECAHVRANKFSFILIID